MPAPILGEDYREWIETIKLEYPETGSWIENNSGDSDVQKVINDRLKPDVTQRQILLKIQRLRKKKNSGKQKRRSPPKMTVEQLTSAYAAGESRRADAASQRQSSTPGKFQVGVTEGFKPDVTPPPPRTVVLADIDPEAEKLRAFSRRSRPSSAGLNALTPGSAVMPSYRDTPAVLINPSSRDLDSLVHAARTSLGKDAERATGLPPVDERWSE